MVAGLRFQIRAQLSQVGLWETLHSIDQPHVAGLRFENLRKQI